MHGIDQLNADVAEKVMGLEIHHHLDSDAPPFIWTEGGWIDLPLYTKTHADDALVLKHIVAEWSTKHMNRFWEELSNILAARQYGFEAHDLVSIAFMEYYEPGDFSRAALAVVDHEWP